MDKIAIIQRFTNPQGMHEKACSELALSGSAAGFDIIGMYNDTFDKKLLLGADLLIITDILSLPMAHKNDLETILFNGALFVRLVMDLSEIENNAIDYKIYELSEKNYFCSPNIFKKYLLHIKDLKICDGQLTFLAGKIDESWNDFINTEKKDQEKAQTNFWRDIDYILQKKRILENVN